MQSQEEYASNLQQQIGHKEESEQRREESSNNNSMMKEEDVNEEQQNSEGEEDCQSSDNDEDSQQQSEQSSSEIEEEEDKNWQQQITINQDTVNQILTVHLRPGQSFYHRGQIIISNRSFVFPQQEGFDWDKVLENIKFRMSPPKKVKNTDRTVAYYCLRRIGGGGKILHLSQATYGTSFVIDYYKLLTINCPSENYSIHPHYGSTKLMKLKFKDVLQNNPQSSVQNINNKDSKGRDNVVMTLQTEPGSIIIEKYLGEEQKFYTRLNNILAINQNMIVKKQQNDGVCITGPGYVFMESHNSEAYSPQNPRSNKFALLMLFFFFFFFNFLEI